MGPLLEFDLALPPRGSRTRLRALHAGLRRAILDGRLHPDLRLPSTRALARACAVSRTTAVLTYERLLSEGYVVARAGSGTFVATGLPRRARAVARAARAAGDRRLSGFWRFATEPRLPLAPLRFDFRLGSPDVGSFPCALWRRLLSRAVPGLSRVAPDLEDSAGRSALREGIARHVSFARAVACEAEDVIVTAGAQQAFDLLARVLVARPRLMVAVEDPGYAPLRTAFAAAGARLVAVPVDAEGLRVERVPAAARIICVTPSHQFPLGVPMSIERRTALLARAEAQGAVIVEDDYDGEFRFGGRPLDALQTLDRSQLVCYVGTFSKSLSPALRSGYIVAPPWARRALIAAKSCADGHADALVQEALAAFIAEGHLARHLRRMHRLYQRRRQLLLDTLSAKFSGWLQPMSSVAGLHLAAWLNPAIDAEALVARARQREVGVRSLRSFFLGRASRPGLVFGYGTIGEGEIEEGLARLRTLLPA